MDIREFIKAFDNGCLHKVHVDFILDERGELLKKLSLAKELLITLRFKSFRDTTEATEQIDRVLDQIRVNS